MHPDPTLDAPRKSRLSIVVPRIRESVVPRIREGAVRARETILPSEPAVRRTRLILVTAVVLSIAGCAYAATSSFVWAFMVVAVGVPIVALPAFILVGIVLEALSGRGRRDE